MLSEENSTKKHSQVTRSATQTAISSCPRDVFMRQLDFVLSRWTESILKAWLQNMSQSWSRQTAPCGNTRRFWPMAPCCHSLDSVIVMASFFSGDSPSVTLACIAWQNAWLCSELLITFPEANRPTQRYKQRPTQPTAGRPPPHTHNAWWLLPFLLQQACSLKTHLLIASH